MTKPLSRRAWLNRHVPGEKDRHIESAWLDEHWLYGGKVHEETAAALVAALRGGTTRAVGHALHLKLFAEFANALEVAGAWGWVLRTRRRHPLLLDAFLTYDRGDPRSFFAASLRNRGSAVGLLDLPARAKVIEALTVIFPGSSTDERRRTLDEVVPKARSLAGRFFDHDELIPTIFNRTKHGATLLDDESLSAREFWVLAPHFNVRNSADKARYLMPKFTLNREQITSLERSVKSASELIQLLAGLAKAMNEAGILYPPSHPLMKDGIPARLPRASPAE